MLYVMAYLKNGDRLVSEFENLRGIRSLSAEVMSGRKAFPVWRPVGDTHPVSGERVSIRTRTFINGRSIEAMEVVRPTVDEHGFDPENFEPAPLMKSGPNGLWAAPDNEDCPEGVEPGTEFPVHRDSDTGRRYVILRIAEGASEEVRHYIDPDIREEVASWDDTEDEFQDTIYDGDF